ncbi:MAG: glycosyltransferase family 2 protein [bacterium]|nr:glycosyltransferase family 2 protein [bacterium]
MKIKKITLIVPAYNEADNLRNLIPQWLAFCRKNDYMLIIINDGSYDNSRVILDKYKHEKWLKIVHHKMNRGYGAALKTGIIHAQTEYAVFLDADGQHELTDVVLLYRKLLQQDADMIVGSRLHLKSASLFRGLGKWIIRRVAKILLPIKINDINSGMKLFKTALAKKYISVCPDSMSFSDIIVLVFVNQGNFVIEHPITVRQRSMGRSTIRIRTAFETLWEILNITVLFRPMKVFLPLSIIFTTAGILWEIPILLAKKGLSMGAGLIIIIGLGCLVLGLIAEQLSTIMKMKIQ